MASAVMAAPQAMGDSTTGIRSIWPNDTFVKPNILYRYVWPDRVLCVIANHTAVGTHMGENVTLEYDFRVFGFCTSTDGCKAWTRKGDQATLYSSVTRYIPQNGTNVGIECFPGYIGQPNTDFIGVDMGTRNRPNTSPAACKDLCEKNDKCKGFVYKINTNTCTLKSEFKVGNRRDVPTAMAYYRLSKLNV